MNGVWKESVRRAAELSEIANGGLSLREVRSVFNVVAMEVLVAVGFGQKIATLTKTGSGHRDSFMGSLGFLLDNIIVSMVFAKLNAPSWMMPKILRRLQAAIAEVRLYMQEMVLREIQQTRKTSTTKKTLLSAMVQANEAEKEIVSKDGGRASYLTEAELYGNLFVFNVAGYETTASTMTFALSYLALHPDVQDWIREEIDTKHSATADYSIVYPTLVRWLTCMYETLRLASPTRLLVRSPVEPRGVDLMTRDGPKFVIIQPGTLVGSHFYAGHLSPRWGDDALEFKPQRFVDASVGDEKFKMPDGPVHMPWTAGSRGCPGKKFSQVEFVGLVATL